MYGRKVAVVVVVEVIIIMVVVLVVVCINFKLSFKFEINGSRRNAYFIYRAYTTLFFVVSGIAVSILSMLSSAKEKSMPQDNAMHAEAAPGQQQDNWMYHDDKC